MGPTEFFMVNELKRISRPQVPVQIAQMLDDDLAERANEAARVTARGAGRWLQGALLYLHVHNCEIGALPIHAPQRC